MCYPWSCSLPHVQMVGLPLCYPWNKNLKIDKNQVTAIVYSAFTPKRTAVSFRTACGRRGTVPEGQDVLTKSSRKWGQAAEGVRNLISASCPHLLLLAFKIWTRTKFQLRKTRKPSGMMRTAPGQSGGSRKGCGIAEICFPGLVRDLSWPQWIGGFNGLEVA